MPKPHRVLLFVLLLLPALALAEDAPAKADKLGKLPHVSFDAKKKQVRVECEALAVEAPLEFFCVLTNTSEHESVLRTPAKPSHVHTALLAIGLKPGKPVGYSEAQKKWIPPQGPPLHVSLEFKDKNDKTVTVPAYRCMRDVRTKKEMKPMSWIFAGSRVMNDGSYAADVTGYVISVVNFDLTMIDIPDLASNSNEALEWERNPDVAPPGGAKVTMIIEPAGKDEGKKPAPAEKEKKAGARGVVFQETAAAGAAREESEPVSEVAVDEARMKSLRDRWARVVRPHASALREAAQAHYEVISEMRREQQRLIDEADRIQRAIDALEKEYQDFTTPHPATDTTPDSAVAPVSETPSPPPAEAGAIHDPLDSGPAPAER